MLLAGGLLAGKFKFVKEVDIICSSFFSREIEELIFRFRSDGQLHVFWSSWIFSFSTFPFVWCINWIV
jgi:hypothetical protein